MVPRDLRAQEKLDEEVETCAATYPSLISSGDSVLLSEDLRRGRHSSSVNSCRNPYCTIALYRLNFASSASIRCAFAFVCTAGDIRRYNRGHVYVLCRNLEEVRLIEMDHQR